MRRIIDTCEALAMLALTAWIVASAFVVGP